MSKFSFVTRGFWLSVFVVVGCTDGNGGGGPADVPQDVSTDLSVNDITGVDINDSAANADAVDMSIVPDGLTEDWTGSDGVPSDADDVSLTDLIAPVDGSADVPKPDDISPTDGGGDPDMGTPPPGCCLSNADCDIFRSPVAHVCAPTIEGPTATWGVCKPLPPAGRCWGDSDCKAGQSCHNPNVCLCGGLCAVEDQLGVCVTPGSTCTPIQSEWVAETCNAASVVIWDGEQCVGTCPGCCGCAPFCDLTFSSIESCEKTCLSDQCLYIGALADAPYGYTQQQGAECPTTLLPLVSRCKTDTDCANGKDGSGKSCVYGNCVYCWGDFQCEVGDVCRAGRCVSAAADCPPLPSCSKSGCFLFTPSESPCPVCVCDSVFNKACTEDGFCMMFSSVKYHGCIYGRCATCRNDTDCPFGTCLPPGLCYQTTPETHKLYGTWLIGWPGGLDHFSYFRFEPDGTLRRGHYGASGSFMDDIPPINCTPEELKDHPLLGAWEPEVTQSGFLVVRITLNVVCGEGAHFTARYNVTLKDNNQADFYDIDSGNTLMGAKLTQDSCSPDFSLCDPPTFDVFVP